MKKVYIYGRIVIIKYNTYSNNKYIYTCRVNSTQMMRKDIFLNILEERDLIEDIIVSDTIILFF